MSIEQINRNPDKPAGLFRQVAGDLPAIAAQAADGPAFSGQGAGDLLDLRDAAGTQVMRVSQTGVTTGTGTTAPALVLPPSAILAAGAAVWPAANRAMFARFQLPTATPLRHLNWVCGTSSGNIQVGVVALSGANRTSYTRVMDSGVIACPTAGDIRTDLGVTTLPAGDYAVFLWADNVTFQARFATNPMLTALRIVGVVSSLTTGVPASGVLAWASQTPSISLEGDV